jgi:hypothetical protein
MVNETMTDLQQGSILRESIVTKLVDQYAPVGRYDHALDGLVRFNTFGAVRGAVLATAHEIALAYPQLAERIHTRFGMSGWEHD